MPGAGPAVLLMPPLADAGELAAALSRRAEDWARECAGGAIHGLGGGDALPEAIDRVAAAPGVPVLVVWPVLAQLRPEHATAALGDLEAGCDVVLGPLIDGGLYLLGLARPVPALPSLSEQRWQDPDVMTLAFTAAREAGLEVGILRAERALRREADVRAALADPLLPAEIRRALGSAGDGH